MDYITQRINNPWEKFVFDPRYLYRLDKIKQETSFFPEYYRSHKNTRPPYSSNISSILTEYLSRYQPIPDELKQINVIRFMIDNNVDDYYIENYILSQRLLTQINNC